MRKLTSAILAIAAVASVAVTLPAQADSIGSRRGHFRGNHYAYGGGYGHRGHGYWHGGRWIALGVGAAIVAGAAAAAANRDCYYITAIASAISDNEPWRFLPRLFFFGTFYSRIGNEVDDDATAALFPKGLFTLSPKSITAPPHTLVDGPQAWRSARFTWSSLRALGDVISAA